MADFQLGGVTRGGGFFSEQQVKDYFDNPNNTPDKIQADAIALGVSGAQLAAAHNWYSAQGPAPTNTSYTATQGADFINKGIVPPVQKPAPPPDPGPPPPDPGPPPPDPGPPDPGPTGPTAAPDTPIYVGLGNIKGATLTDFKNYLNTPGITKHQIKTDMAKNGIQASEMVGAWNQLYPDNQMSLQQALDWINSPEDAPAPGGGPVDTGSGGQNNPGILNNQEITVGKYTSSKAGFINYINNTSKGQIAIDLKNSGGTLKELVDAYNLVTPGANLTEADGYKWLYGTDMPVDNVDDKVDDTKNPGILGGDEIKIGTLTSSKAGFINYINNTDKAQIVADFESSNGTLEEFAAAYNLAMGTTNMTADLAYEWLYGKKQTYIPPTDETKITLDDVQPSYSSSTYNAPTVYDPGAGEGKGTVQGQMKGILASGSPYMQAADLKGKEYSNSRGLLNSTLGGEAAQKAAIEAALPIAQQDAQTYATAGQSAQNAAQQAELINVQGSQSSILSSQDAWEAGQLSSIQSIATAKLSLQNSIQAQSLEQISQAGLNYRQGIDNALQEKIAAANISTSEGQIVASAITSLGDTFQKQLETINTNADMTPEAKLANSNLLQAQYEANVESIASIYKIPITWSIAA